jgi:hypothetical protein
MVLAAVTWADTWLAREPINIFITIAAFEKIRLFFHHDSFK